MSKYKVKRVCILLFFILLFITPAGYFVSTISKALPNSTMDSTMERTSIFSNPYTIKTDYDFQEALSKYLNYTETTQFLKALELEFPDVVELTSIGESYEGRMLWLVKITNKHSTVTHKNNVLLIGVHHAREYISLMVPLFIAYNLATEFYTNTTIQKLLNYTTYYIIPLLNPDGYTEALYHNPWQRKNTHRIDEDNDGKFGEDCPEDVNGDGIIGYIIDDKTGDWTIEGFDNDGDGKINEDWIGGVDLNRNYNISWGIEKGASSDKHSEIYFGSAPFSENETRAVRNFVETLVQQNKKFSFAISYHSGIKAVLYPWAHTDVEPDDDNLIKYAEFISNITGYQAMQGYKLYQVCGDWGDWMYSVYHVPAYTIEVYYNRTEYAKLTTKPTQKINGSWYIPFNVTKFFNPPEKDIIEVATPNYKAVTELAYKLIPPEHEEVLIIMYALSAILMVAVVVVISKKWINKKRT